MSAETPTIGLAFIAGFLSFLSPCVLPLVPAYIGYLGGRMTNTIAAQVALSGSGTGATISQPTINSRFSVVIHGLFFVAGFTLVFTIVGIITSALIGSAREAIGRIGGVIIIFFGLHFMGILPTLINRALKNKAFLENRLTSLIAALIGAGFILWGITGTLQPMLNKTFSTTAGDTTSIEWPTVIALLLVAVYLLWLALDGAFTRPGLFWTKVLTTFQAAFFADTRRQLTATGRQGLAGSALMGIVFAAGWTPCLGPILGSILGLSLSTTGNNVVSAAALLIAYSLGLGIPFLMAAFMLDSTQGILRRLQPHMHKIELITGGFLVFIGILVASGQLQSISQNATQQFSDLSVRVENCGVGFLTGEMGISYLGPCLKGETTLFKMGNTVQNQFGSGTDMVKYIFPAEAGSAIDIELKDRANVLSPILKLYDENQQELVSIDTISLNDKQESVLAISSFKIPENGIYTLSITNMENPAPESPFTLRVKLTDPVTSSSIPNAPISVLGSITDAAASIDSPISGIAIGDVAPDFETVTETGNGIKLSDFRGKVVLLNFWGTWCGPCRVELPAFESAYQANPEQRFTILAVDNKDSTDAVAKFRDTYGLSFPLLMDDDQTIAKLYGVFSFPSTFVLNPDGVIVARHFGALTADQIQELVNQALT